MKKYVIANTADLTQLGWSAEQFRTSVDKTLCVVESDMFPPSLIVDGPYTAEEIIPVLANSTWRPTFEVTQ